MSVNTHPAYTASNEAEITARVPAGEDGSFAYASAERTLWVLQLTSVAPIGPTVLATQSGTGRWVLVPTTAASSNLSGVVATFNSASGVGVIAPLPAGSYVLWCEVDVDVAFDGSPDILVGTALAPSALVSSGEVNLAAAGRYRFDGVLAIGAATTLQFSFTPGGATVGSGRVHAVIQQ